MFTLSIYPSSPESEFTLKKGYFTLGKCETGLFTLKSVNAGSKNSLGNFLDIFGIKILCPKNLYPSLKKGLSKTFSSNSDCF